MRYAFPELQSAEKFERIFFQGPFYLMYEGSEIERFEIEVELPIDFPKGIPVVRELEGKIDRSEHYHTGKDGTHCLFVPGERWKYWPEGSTLVEFMEGVVRSFYIGFEHKKRIGSWPFDQRGHSEKGVFEAYSEMLGFSDPEVILAFIRILAEKDSKKHRLCPCGSGEKSRNCHGDFIDDWRSKISSGEAKQVLNTVERYIASKNIIQQRNNVNLQRALDSLK